MEKKTHILFTITWIYWLSTLLKSYWIDNSLALWYIALVSSFPIISIPFQALATTLPDSDGNTRLKRTILLPAVWIINLITSHRGATHDVRWIIIFWALLYWLYVIWTNIIILTIICFLSVTITFVMIDKLRISFFWIFEIKTNIVEYILVWIILIFFPILLIPEVYNIFLISIFMSYIWHMLGDAPSLDKWKPFITNKIKIWLPDFLSFKVGWFTERYIIAPMLIIILIGVILIEKDFYMEKFKNELKLVKNQYINIIENPEILYNDLEKFNSRVKRFTYEMEENIENLKIHFK